MSSMNSCLVCHTGSDTLPLLALEYRGAAIHICPQHLPVLIHQPQMLVGLLEGADQFRPSEVHD